MKRAWIGVVVVAALFGSGCSSGGSDAEADATSTSEAGTTTSTAPATSELEPSDYQTPPSSINGITLQDDTIWVASIEDDQVLQVEAETGAILRRVATEGAGPDDVAVAPDGSVWTTGFTSGHLGRIDPDGTYEVVATLEPGINPLEFGSDGTLYVGTYGADGVLYAVGLDGGAPVPDATPEVVVEGLPNINAFGVLDDDTIVAPAGGLSGPSEAVLIDPAKGTVTTFVDDLPAVAAGATDADGTPYVLANLTGEVFAIDVEAGTSKRVLQAKVGAPFDNLAFAEDGTLYVSSFTAPAITVVAPDGSERVIPIGS